MQCLIITTKYDLWHMSRKGSRPRGVEIQCYWKAYSNIDTTLGFTWIEWSNLEGNSMPFGLKQRVNAIERLT